MNYDAVIYDLDGTLVELTVDWGDVAADVAEVLRQRDVDPGDAGLWEMLELSDERGHRDAVEEAIAAHEHDGALASTRLALADGLPHDVPVGVCSLNAEAACRTALETHELTDHVQTVVGRDTYGSEKPDPEGLLAVLEELGVDADRAVFVGDSERDAEAARRAGIDFEWARDFDQRRYRA